MSFSRRVRELEGRLSPAGCGVWAPDCLAQALTPSALAQTLPSQRPALTSLLGSVPCPLPLPALSPVLPQPLTRACLAADAQHTLAG